MKRLITLVLTGIIAFSLCSCQMSKSSKPQTYNDVLEICCDAINESNKAMLDDVIYEDLGEDYIDEYVYKTVEEFFEDDDHYGKLTTEIHSYGHYTSSSDLEHWQEMIFEESGKIIDLEEIYEIKMKHSSSIEIALFKTNGKWYVLYLDL